jgi:flagellar FliL protein
MAKKTKLDLIKLDPKDTAKETPPDPKGQETKVEDSASWGKKIFRVKKSILMIGLAVLVFSGGSVVMGSRLGWIHVPGLPSPPKAQSSSPSIAHPPPPAEKQEMGQVVKLSSLVTNLKEESGRNYLKTTIVLEVEKKAEVEEIQSKMSLLTDAAILTLSDKRIEDLKQPGARDRLKEELLAKMNQHLEPKKIARLYFDEFLYQ